MRGPLLLLLALSGLASAPGAAELRLHPVALPERRGALRAGDRMQPSPAQLALQSQRIRRWRAQRDVLTRPGVDWSRWASRSRAARLRPGFGRVQALRAAGAEDAEHAAAAATDTLGPPDTIHVAVLRVDFLADRDGPLSTGDGRFDLSGPDPDAVPLDRPPRNRRYFERHLDALARYYNVQSYGRTVIVGDVYPSGQDSAYHVSDMADFGPWEFSQDMEIYRRAVGMFHTMLQAADQQARAQDEPIPWDRVDRVIVIHAGSDLQSDIRLDTPRDIPSFTLGVPDSDAVVIRDVRVPGDSVVIDRASFIPETATQDGFYGVINGVLAHECGHLFFGFADLYNTATGFPVVGFWSLMDSGNLVGALVDFGGEPIYAVGLLPPSVDPLQRFFTTDTLRFAAPRRGVRDTLARGERHPDMRQVLLSSDEELLLENRWVPDVPVVAPLQDDSTRVILGPPPADSTDYDLLLPGGGILVWHVDESVVFVGGLRENPDEGVNTDPRRLGVWVVEADGLADLGDPTSTLALGSPYDPFFLSNNARLDDDTTPNTLTSSGTRPHVRIQFLSDPDSLMPILTQWMWTREGWPVHADFPPGGPALLAVDADGSRRPDVAWAGGADSLVVLVPGGRDSLVANPDSAALFVVRADGRGLFDSTAVLYRLPRRPLRELAAVPLGEPGAFGVPARGPSLFAASTVPAGADTSAPGGRVYLVDHFGNLLPGWPPLLPSPVTTPPVIAGTSVNSAVYVGCADGRVYVLDLQGQVIGTSTVPLAGGVRGRLAVVGGGQPPDPEEYRIAAAGGGGDVIVLDGALAPASSAWPRHVADPAGPAPGLLWVGFDAPGRSVGASPLCSAGTRVLVVQLPTTLLAFCPLGEPLPGWGQTSSDTLLDALAAGDVDGDGFNEVVTQTRTSKLAYWEVTGAPSPGWPLRTTREDFASGAAPLAVDVDGDGLPELVGLNGSGILAARRANGDSPGGWPLATGVGVAGSPCYADLDQDGHVEMVAPDRTGLLWAYSLPIPFSDPAASPWPMLGGDPGRSFALGLDRQSSPRPTGPSLVEKGSLMAFPNPAKRSAVSFAYRLAEPGEVEFTILDPSGHEVTRFTRPGNRADNLVRWDPGQAPAGLYLARLRFKAGGREQVEVLRVGLLR